MVGEEAGTGGALSANQPMTPRQSFQPSPIKHDAQHFLEVIIFTGDGNMQGGGKSDTNSHCFVKNT